MKKIDAFNIVLPQSSVIMMETGQPKVWVGGLWLFEQWLSICGHWNCKGPAVSAQCAQVHGAWWGSYYSTGCYGRTSLHHL